MTTSDAQKTRCRFATVDASHRCQHDGPDTACISELRAVVAGRVLSDREAARLNGRDKWARLMEALANDESDGR